MLDVIGGGGAAAAGSQVALKLPALKIGPTLHAILGIASYLLLIHATFYFFMPEHFLVMSSYYANTPAI